MKRQAMFAAFLLVFTACYAAMHAYTLGRLWTWLGHTIDSAFVITTAALALSFPVANLLTVRWTNRATHGIYDVAALWMGTLTILLTYVLAGEAARFFLDSRTVAYACIGLTTITSAWAVRNATQITVRRYTISGAVTRTHTFALASDIHAGPVHGKRYLAKVLAKAMAAKPAFLVLPGDLVDGPGHLPDDLLTPLAAVRVPIYYSLGNHEQYVGIHHVERLLRTSPVTVLRDSNVRHGELTIVGIDDREDKDALAKHLPRQSGYTILLYHRPDGLETAATKGVDLMLSGHTHNGQLPIFTLLTRLRFPRTYGWYEHDKTKLYVSCGAGTWGPPMRLFSRSEVVIITVQPQREQAKHF